MMGEDLRWFLVMVAGCSLALSLVWFMLALALGRRRGGVSRRTVLIASIEYLAFFAGFVMLLLLPAAGPRQRSWLLAGCIGGLAVMFLVMHVTLALLVLRPLQRWLEGKWGGSR